MKYADYQKNVLARCSTGWHGGRVPTTELVNALQQFVKWGNVLDRAKKSLFYDRDFYPGNPAFNATEHYTVVDDDYQFSDKEKVLIHALLGHMTESVELAEAFVAMLQGTSTFDDVNLQEEFGDAEWYRALALSQLGQTHEQNLAQNDAKLEKRFGPAFTKEKANERNLDEERKTLEGK